ncbi:MAG: hypothetical protein OXC46_10545, partial [Thaumarchaeota archaeon]|nr:hypothetical protein [Nitrososphaerota archaeon]
MFRQSKTNIALCGFLMVIVGFGFQAVYADDDKETMKQLERIAIQSDQQATQQTTQEPAQQSAQPQSNHDSGFILIFAPGGITYYDDKLWVVNQYNPSVDVYSTDGTIDADASFSLIPENDNAQGITYGDGKFWVVNWNYDVDVMRDVGDNMVHVYNLDGTYDADASFSLIPETDSPFGITYYDDKLWVVSTLDARIYVYSTDGTYDADASFDLAVGNTHPSGITYGDGKFWVTEDGLFGGIVGVYAYNLDGTYDADASFDLAIQNTEPNGITYYDGMFWVVEWSFAYDAVYMYEPGPSLESRVTSIETTLTGLETTMTGIDTRMTGLETNTTNIDTRITGLETNLTGL